MRPIASTRKGPEPVTDSDQIPAQASFRRLFAVRKVKAGKGKIALCAIQSQVREVFDISGLSSVFAIHPERDAAIQSVA